MVYSLHLPDGGNQKFLSSPVAHSFRGWYNFCKCLARLLISSQSALILMQSSRLVEVESLTLATSSHDCAKPSVSSPTLTNPDMILPNGNNSLSSLPDHDASPPSPQLRLRAVPKSSQARDHRRQRLSREILRDSDADVASSKARKRLSAKASAPALKTQDSFEMAKKRLSVERKWSDGSAESINSEVLEQMRWPPLDSVNGENMDEDEYGDRKSAIEDDEAEEGHVEDENDPYSSMSRRAEIILANAKKRLNVSVSD